MEAGAVTGELEVSTRTVGEALDVLVRYAGAEDWYQVEGSPIEVSDDAADAGEELALRLLRLHEGVVARLRRPGQLVDGNEEAVSLKQV